MIHWLGHFMICSTFSWYSRLYAVDFHIFIIRFRHCHAIRDAISLDLACRAFNWVGFIICWKMITTIAHAPVARCRLPRFLTRHYESHRVSPLAKAATCRHAYIRTLLLPRLRITVLQYFLLRYAHWLRGMHFHSHFEMPPFVSHSLPRQPAAIYAACCDCRLAVEFLLAFIYDTSQLHAYTTLYFCFCYQRSSPRRWPSLTFDALQIYWV